MERNLKILEELVKKQSAQIDSLKKAVSKLQLQVNNIVKSNKRNYENSSKNAREINSIKSLLRKEHK